MPHGRLALDAHFSTNVRCLHERLCTQQGSASTIRIRALSIAAGSRFAQMPGAQRSDLCLQPENAQALGGIPGASIGTRRSTKAAATTFTSQRLAGPRQMEALVLTRHKPSVASYPTASCGRGRNVEEKSSPRATPPTSPRGTQCGSAFSAAGAARLWLLLVPLARQRSCWYA